MFELLKNGPAIKLMPKDINDCIERMDEKEEEESISEKAIDNLKLIVKDVLESHSRGLEYIRSFCKPGEELISYNKGEKMKCSESIGK